jgi:DUF3037 family protein
MADKRKLEFFLLRYVPDAIKDEFVNIGVVMTEPGANGSGFADVRFTRDWRRVRCLDPEADIEMLEALEREIRSQLGAVHDRGLLLRRMEDSFSNLVQLSPTKGCLAEEPAREIEVLAKLYFEGPKPASRGAFSARQRILRNMRDAFEQSGVWTLLMKDIPVAPYTKPGDPLKFDFGYRVGETIKLFHAVSLKANVDQAILLASRYPTIANSIAQMNNAFPSMTAVVDDALDRGRNEVQFALQVMEDAQIQVAASAQMQEIAQRAKQDLRA